MKSTPFIHKHKHALSLGVTQHCLTPSRNDYRWRAHGPEELISPRQRIVKWEGHNQTIRLSCITFLERESLVKRGGGGGALCSFSPVAWSRGCLTTPRDYDKQRCAHTKAFHSRCWEDTLLEPPERWVQHRFNTAIMMWHYQQLKTGF